MALAAEAAIDAEAEALALEAALSPEPISEPVEELAEVQESISQELETEAEPMGYQPLGKHSFTLTLAPGETAEIKVYMSQGDMVLYSWETESGTINFDNHGDNESISYHNYTKGTFVEGDAGVIQADFDGRHGWFWRNRGEETITLTLHTQGAYSEIERLL